MAGHSFFMEFKYYYLLGMSHDAPNTITAQAIMQLPVRRDLRVGQCLQSQACTEETNGDSTQYVQNVRIQRNGAVQNAERNSEWEGYGGLEEYFRQELGEEGLVPETGLFLVLFVARVIFTAGDAPRCDAVEQSQPPGGDTSKEQLLRPGERFPSNLERDIAVVESATDTAPPGIDDGGQRPQPVLDLKAIGRSRYNIAGCGET